MEVQDPRGDTWSLRTAFMLELIGTSLVALSWSATVLWLLWNESAGWAALTFICPPLVVFTAWMTEGTGAMAAEWGLVFGVLACLLGFFISAGRRK